MLLNKHAKAYRCLPLLISVIFAAAYSIPINAQTRTPTPSQPLEAEQPNPSATRQPLQTFGGQLAVFLHEEGVNSAVFSPDGSQILTASLDNTARLWDTQGNLLVEFRGHEDEITSAVFSPNGTQILTISNDGSARLWEISGAMIALFGGEEKIKIISAKFHPDGQQIITQEYSYTDNSTITYLRNASGKIIKTFPGSIQHIIYSPDQEKVVTIATNNFAPQLSHTSGQFLADLVGHERGVWNAKFSPNSDYILTISYDHTARLWDASGQLLVVFREHQNPIRKSIFSSDSRQILTGSTDGTVHLWDVSGQKQATFQHQKEVGDLEFSSDGSKILTSSEGKAYLWNTAGELLIKFETAENEQITSVKLSSDGSKILMASSDGTARLLNISSVNAIQQEQTVILQSLQSNIAEENAQLTILQRHQGDVLSLAFSPDGRQILTGSMDETALLWNLQGDVIAEFSANFIPFEEYANSINSVAFHPNQDRVMTAGVDGMIRLWNYSGNLITEFQAHKDQIDSATFSPDGRQILTASRDRTARLWDLSGNLVIEFPGHSDWTENAVFSSDGNTILTAGNNGIVYLWDKLGNLLLEFKSYETWLNNAVFSPDGNTILTVGQDGNAQRVRLWDTEGNLLQEFQGHEQQIFSAIFSPDGSQILTVSLDKTARLWDVEGNLLAIFRGHENYVTDAAFSPDGQQILTASLDRTARLWDVSVAIAAQAEQIATQQAFLGNVSNQNAQQAAAILEEGTQLNQQGTLKSRQLALQKLEEALELYQADNNSAQAALTLLEIGNIQANLGQFQTAFDSYNQALSLSQEAGAKLEEAKILNSLGQLYNNLADPKTALDYYNQALPLFYQLNDKGAVATTLNNIGATSATLEQYQNALDSYNQALTISRIGGDQAAEASALMGIGNSYIASQDWSTALSAYNQSLQISLHLNDQVKQTTILNQLGKINAALGQNATALEHYNQALSLAQQLGYKTEEAHILYNQAIFNRQQNNLTTAQTQIKTAINIIESLRTQIASQELRQSYFARNQDYYQFYIDLLMQLHQQNPNQGYDGEALHISERARARSLIELLTEATANIRSGVDPKLLELEQSLQQQLNAFEHRKYQLQSGQYTEQELTEINQTIDNVLAELNQIEAEIRASSPRYSDLKYPEPLNLQQIQQQVLDDDTLLLEYSLGKDRSYLWAVTKNTINSFVLPKQSEIEAAVETFRQSVTQDSAGTIDTGLPLSQILLAPIAHQFGNKRLLIVGDGVLQYVPFAALPLPDSPSNPLLVQNEIVTLPSISTVAIQRRQLQNRSVVAKTVAVIADPVFSLKDDRITGNPPAQNTNTLSNRNLNRAARNLLGLGEGGGGQIFDRLKYTRDEANQIIALVPETQRFQAFDFQASRQIATNPNLAEYQIIHLATHGLVDPVNPELSGIVLSLYDQKGNPEDGFFRLHDIFNLNLPAELVVLSACETGLGENVKGEGLVGLTRGFMYAGARRVVVSLWSVNDVATSELMAKFYQKMLQGKQNPTTALREAQLEMWNSQEWKSPYYWAAFTVQGDWR